MPNRLCSLKNWWQNRLLTKSTLQEEPYQMRPFSKSPQNIEVTAADFLPDGKQLYMVVADADCNIHVLQFDPDSTCALFLLILSSSLVCSPFNQITPISV